MEKSFSIDNKTAIIMEWNHDHEKILIEWADKAMCYRWLHSKSNLMYSKLNTIYTIPVIIISTLTGTANFASAHIPQKFIVYYGMVIGFFNIIAGIITTIQQFLKITQLNEAHRVSFISWDKFYRNIKTELSKPPNQRINVQHMLKVSKEEYDRLIETSPLIVEHILKMFNDEFKNSASFKNIYKPEVCNILQSTEENINKWYTEENNRLAELSIIRKNNILHEEKKQKYFKNYKIVTNFKKMFYNINNRYPLEKEIIDNLKEDISVYDIKDILHNINFKKNELINNNKSSNNINNYNSNDSSNDNSNDSSTTYNDNEFI